MDDVQSSKKNTLNRTNWFPKTNIWYNESTCYQSFIFSIKLLAQILNIYNLKMFFLYLGKACVRNRTRLHFDVLHSFMGCAQTSAFCSTAHVYKYKTKRHKKWSEDTEKVFCWLVTRLPMYLKSTLRHTNRTFQKTRNIWH